jgi:hypothetical protein
MSNTDRKIEDAVAASYGGEVRGELKRRALFGMITKTAFVAPVVASFALDALTMDHANAAFCGNTVTASCTVAVSDIRMKQNIKRVGTHALGIGLYEFSYIGSAARLTGVMAQEVLPVASHAVVTMPSGIMKVNYAAIGL